MDPTPQEPPNDALQGCRQPLPSPADRHEDRIGKPLIPELLPGPERAEQSEAHPEDLDERPGDVETAQGDNRMFGFHLPLFSPATPGRAPGQVRGAAVGTSKTITVSVSSRSGSSRCRRTKRKSVSLP